MTDLDKALGDISSIRRQIAHSTEFRGYGPATLAATGVLAMLAAVVQAWQVPDPSSQFSKYLALWMGTALISAGLIAAQTYTRARRIHSAMADEMIRTAVEQFLPAAGAGMLLTLVIVREVPSVLWMLPGLWQIVFSLGVFASLRFLPRFMPAVGAWYLLTGLTCLALADKRALSAWAMGISFGIGQGMVAGILLVASKGADHDD